ncbi:hypothetical protein [Nocardia sp. BMG51109]|uniref:hypothetical protein n=1 Tax=Nocardia sp. BMG51109 TaxID=1056816 RepID=UPI0004671E47|nr:hypothetical protein [Nocardia sp. BMG51109]
MNSSSNSSAGVGALVCGILAFFVCGIILGPVAIHLGSQSDSGMAKAGKILGIVAVVLWVIGIVIGLASAG